MCGKINEIPLLGMLDEWYQFVKTEGTEGNPPKSMEDAMTITKNYNGMHFFMKLMIFYHIFIKNLRKNKNFGWEPPCGSVCRKKL
jgi:hypothetical protein